MILHVLIRLVLTSGAHVRVWIANMTSAGIYAARNVADGSCGQTVSKNAAQYSQYNAVSA
jgi:hypothetical protein